MLTPSSISSFQIPDNFDTPGIPLIPLTPLIVPTPQIVNGLTPNTLTTLPASKKKKRKHAKILKFKTFTAYQKEPSVLWVSKTGKYYRTVIAARIDKSANAITINPATGKPIVPVVPGKPGKPIVPGVPNMPKDNLTIAVDSTGDSTAVPTATVKDNKIIYIVVGIVALIVFIKLVK